MRFETCEIVLRQVAYIKADHKIEGGADAEGLENAPPDAGQFHTPRTAHASCARTSAHC
jgi:hypothetical protein